MGTSTTTTTTTTTQTTTEELLEIDSGIVDAEVTKTVAFSTTPEEVQTTLKEITTTRPEVVTDAAVVETTVGPSEEEFEVTTFRYPLRLHRPKSYPGAPTAKDDYYHLESIKNKVTSDDIITTSTELPTTTVAEEVEENNDNDERNVSKDVFGAIRREEYFKNWVARKYRKPEDGKSKFTLSEFPTTASSTPPPTSSSPSSASSSSTTEVETEAAVTLENNILLPFAPTVLPKLDDYARRQKKISFLETEEQCKK